MDFNGRLQGRDVAYELRKPLKSVRYLTLTWDASCLQRKHRRSIRMENI